MLDHSCDITEYLAEGENQIVLEMIPTNRNLFGPFHHPEKDPLCVGPADFGEEAFNIPINTQEEDYALVDWGLNRVFLEYKKQGTACPNCVQTKR